MATPAEKLEAAETALHMKLTGQLLSEVRDATGEMIRFSAFSIAELQAYIERLKGEISASPKVARPLRLVF